MVRFFLLFSLSIFASSTVIISDIDDTIKISAIKNPAILKYTLNNQEFFGLSELYNLFANKDLNRKIIYVTGQPGKLHLIGKKFLEENNYPFNQEILWKNTRKSTLKFKKEIIEKYISSHDPQDKYILIGDNGEYDPLVYNIIKKKFKDKILNIFIHILYNHRGKKQEFSDQIGFLTSVELAVHFFKMGLIDGVELGKIIDQANMEVKKKSNNLLKSWFACRYFQNKYSFPKLDSEELDEFKNYLFSSRNCR